MPNLTIRKLDWKWDKAACVLWAHLTFSDATTFSVGLPLAHVAMTFDACAAEVGLCEGPFVGDVDTVEGLFSSIKKLAKKASKAVSKAVKKTTNVLAQGVAQAAKVARSKVVGYALTATAVAFPAIGAPALAAYAAANRAAAAYEDAKRAKAAIQQGVRTATNLAKVAKGANIARAVRQLPGAAARDPRAALALAAARSVR